jgi:hypothetical protein
MTFHTEGERRHRLRASQNRMLRKLFGPMTDKVTAGVEFRIIKITVNVARMRAKRGACRVE